MKNIMDYEVEGCWTTQKAKGRCANCGTYLQLVPACGHFNSKYKKLKKDDGRVLFCCPKGCSVKVADKKRAIYNDFRMYAKDTCNPYNFELDLTKVHSCWINPQGKIYPFGKRQHINFAIEYLKTTSGSLEDKNWISVSTPIDEDNMFFIQSIKKPNNKQVDAIVVLIMDNKGNPKRFLNAVEDMRVSNSMFAVDV